MKRSATERLPSRAACLRSLLLLSLSCATMPAAHGPSAPFEVIGDPDDATIWIDDSMVGTAAQFATPRHRRIAAGFHRLEVRHPGHYSYYQELDVKPDVPQSVRFTLREVLQ